MTLALNTTIPNAAANLYRRIRHEPATPVAVGTHNHDVRDEWVGRVLQSLPAGLRLLDAGAGKQPYRPRCQHLNYVTQDFAQYDGQGDHSGLQTGQFAYGQLDIVGDITAIPEPDASFDAVLCTEVLEHVPDAVAAIDEFSRLIKPGGHLIITVPFCSLTHFAPYHFATGFSRYFFQTHLTQRGFTIVDLQENGSYFGYLAQELRRLPSVAERYAGAKPDRRQQQAIWDVLTALDAFSARDTGSSELLYFGCFVHAIKEA